MRFRRITIAAAAAATLAAGITGFGQVTATGANAQPANTSAAAPSLHVSGKHLVNARGQRVVLHGVNRSGGEYQCVHGFGFWDGPVDQASLTAMKGWHINAVRVPLNEACWNGESYVARQFRGAAYRKAVQTYVRLLNRNGMVAILDLHWSNGLYTGPASGCSSAQDICQKPMPDDAKSVPLWASVPRTFNGHVAVFFFLFNEPFPNNAPGAKETGAWHCWLHGGH